jgi:hypothetical protein
MLALVAFVAAKPHVVTLDMCIPEKDGIEVLAEDAAKFHGRTDAPIVSKPFRASKLAEVPGRVAAQAGPGARIGDLLLKRVCRKDRTMPRTNIEPTSPDFVPGRACGRCPSDDRAPGYVGMQSAGLLSRVRRG